jgi:hypothetical protein
MSELHKTTYDYSWWNVAISGKNRRSTTRRCKSFEEAVRRRELFLRLGYNAYIF